MSGWADLAAQGGLALERQKAAWRDPITAQDIAFRRLMTLTAGTEFGAQHGLRPGMTLADWRAAMPIREPGEFDPWCDRIKQGHPNVLTSEPVLAFEQTGGSSGGRRMVPYTAGLLADFREMLAAWFGDLLAGYPGIAQGRAYFAVSPVLERTPARFGKIAVGLDSDLAYFGPDLAACLAPNLVWHPALAVTDEAEWAIRTAVHLTAASDLSLISVWSPTFLSRILDQIEKDDSVPRLLHQGAFGLPGLPERARQLEAARRNGLGVRMLWPDLQLVSAWGDGASARPAEALRSRLGGIAFQPKGLLATEGFFTLPLLDVPQALPSLTGCLLEFEDSAGGLHLAHELEEGAVYDLIISTAGGFQRYRIGDQVRAMGLPEAARVAAQVQMLRFEGRRAGCDLVGEKLDEAFVLSCLSGFAPSALMAAGEGGYELWLDPGELERMPTEFLTLLDDRLRNNPQYDYARRLGQLGPPRLRLCAELGARYRSHRLALGHRLSDIKPPALLPFGPLHPQRWAL